MPSCEDIRYGAMGPFKWQKERRQDRNAKVTRVSGYRGSKLFQKDRVRSSISDSGKVLLPEGQSQSELADRARADVAVV
jgi:hypothetical protein